MRKLHFSAAIALFCLAGAHASTIPTIQWNERSDWLNVETYGANGSDAIDDTTAIQAALDAMASSNGPATVYFPAGTYRVSASLSAGNRLGGVQGGALIGHGADTTIEWHGAAGGTMLRSEGMGQGRFIGLVWDGRNIANVGISHESKTGHLYEGRVRHEHEAFINFERAGIFNGTSASQVPTAEVMVWNCLFENNVNGIEYGVDIANQYDWSIKGCEFRNNDTGVRSKKGLGWITNCHFTNSAVQDIWVSESFQVRRCTSLNSNAFLVTGGPSAAMIHLVIEDCQVSDWTSTSGAIVVKRAGPHLIYDCVFTNPPSSDEPIVFQSGTAPKRLIASNNESAGTSALYKLANNDTVVEVAAGLLDRNLTSASQTFFKSDPIVDRPILDVTLPPYNAANNNTGDQTAAIQQAIDDARVANNGSIVYLPAGFYRLLGQLNVTGSNYTIQGSGRASEIQYQGSNVTQPIIQVTSPDMISFEQFALRKIDADQIAILQTGLSDIVYDGYYTLGGVNDNSGLTLRDLPEGSQVFIRHLDGTLTIDDCGRAEIFGDFHNDGVTFVRGGDHPKTGFLGFVNRMGALRTPAIEVKNNHNFVLGGWYNETATNTSGVRLEGGASQGSGRVTIQGTKMGVAEGDPGIPDDRYVLLVDNYEGEVFLGTSTVVGSSIYTYKHTGSATCNMTIAGNVFFTHEPTLSSGSGGTFNTLYNRIRGGTGPSSNYDLVNTNQSAAETATAESFDHMRELGAYDLAWNHPVPGGGTPSVEGLVGYWSFDDDTADDQSGNDNDGVLSGATTFATAVPSAVGSGKSLQLVGTGDNVRIANTSSLAISDGLSLSFWLKADPAVQSGYARIISKTDSSTGWELNNGGVGSLGKIYGNIDNTSGANRAGFVLNGSDPGQLDNQWHHYLWTLDNGESKIYVDGVLVETRTYTTGAGFDDGSDLYFGYNPGSGASAGLKCHLDEVSLFDVVLDADAAAALAANTYLSSGGGNGPVLVAFWDFDDDTADDLTSNGNDGIISGATFGNARPAVIGTGRSIRIVNANSSVRFPNTASLQIDDELSISFWMKARTDEQTGYARVISKTDNATGWEINNGGVVGGAGSIGRVYGNIDNSSGANRAGFVLNGSDPGQLINKWHHYLWTLDNGESKIYVDGVLVETRTYTTGSGFGGTSDLYFGYNPDIPKDGLKCNLDEVAIFSGVLTADDAADLASGAFSP